MLQAVRVVPLAAQDNASAINYVESATYAPFGGLTGMVNGKATGFNGINIADTYNDRLQPLQMYVTTTTISPTVFLNQGNGSFQLAANTDRSSFMVSDLTGKGVVDPLGGTSNLEIWPNNGSLDFSFSPITFSDPTAPSHGRDLPCLPGTHPEVLRQVLQRPLFPVVRLQ